MKVENMNKPHYFIAISLPQSLKDSLFHIQSKLKPNLPYKIWPHKEDLHITLKFLGEVDNKKVRELNKHLNSLTMLTSFKTTVESIGYFGKEDRPRVLWAGVRRNEELVWLKKEVEALTLKTDFENEKRDYKPHITLAKKWNGDPCKEVLKRIVEEYKNKRFELIINEVILYKIHPKSTPKYEAICRYRLKE